MRNRKFWSYVLPSMILLLLYVGCFGIVVIKLFETACFALFALQQEFPIFKEEHVAVFFLTFAMVVYSSFMYIVVECFSWVLNECKNIFKR